MLAAHQEWALEALNQLDIEMLKYNIKKMLNYNTKFSD